MKVAVVLLLFVAIARTQDIDDLIHKIFDNDDTIKKQSNEDLNSDDNTKIIGTDDIIRQIFGSVESSQPPITNPDDSADNTFTGCPSGSECVPYYLCEDENVEEGIIDIHFDDSTPQCPYLHRCCSTMKKLNGTLIKSKEIEGCGHRNVDGIGFRITGFKDQEAQYGEFPWMVAILKKEKLENETINVYQCGGSIISPEVVLTAAHCVDKLPQNIIAVRAGEWDLQNKVELLPDQNRNVVEVSIHPAYNNRTVFNDIALLFLDAPFEIVESVKPVCLPPATETFDNLRCFVTGWGKDASGKYSIILKKGDLPIVPSDTCQTEFRKTRLKNNFELHNSFICAGGETEKETFRGEGGAPLVCPISGSTNRYYQAGISLWHISTEFPSVYANVAQLRPWIDEQLANKNVNSSFYTAI